MSEEARVYRAIIDQKSLPPRYPTHRHALQFWEHLGRTIATYGFLEDVLGRAIFAFTATRQYSAEEIEAAYSAWLPKLEKALTGQLWNLAEAYGREAKGNPVLTTENIQELVDDIKKAAIIRNVLCHGSWPAPDENGASVPRFFNRQMEVFDSAIDVAYLQQVQAHVAQLTCGVIDTITHMGWQFPGSAGPGKLVWERS